MILPPPLHRHWHHPTSAISTRSSLPPKSSSLHPSPNTSKSSVSVPVAAAVVAAPRSTSSANVADRVADQARLPTLSSLSRLNRLSPSPSVLVARAVVVPKQVAIRVPTVHLVRPPQSKAFNPNPSPPIHHKPSPGPPVSVVSPTPPPPVPVASPVSHPSPNSSPVLELAVSPHPHSVGVGARRGVSVAHPALPVGQPHPPTAVSAVNRVVNPAEHPVVVMRVSLQHLRAPMPLPKPSPAMDVAAVAAAAERPMAPEAMAETVRRVSSFSGGLRSNPYSTS